MDDPRPDDEPASTRLNDRLAASDAPGQPSRAPVFRDADAFRPSPETRPAFRGDAAFRDDRFDDPRDRAIYGTSLEDEIRQDDLPLADPGARLAAQLLDGLASLAIAIPAIIGAVIGGIAGGGDSTGILAGIGAVIGLVALAVYQLRLLAAEGQTIGKRAMKIRIVDVEDGSNPGFTRTFWIRGVANGVISAVPYIGSFYALVDILFIFRDDRRCIHDHLAKTVVVKDIA